MSDYSSKPKPKMDIASVLARDKCPTCGGELDTGWECTDCGADWKNALDQQDLAPLILVGEK